MISIRRSVRGLMWATGSMMLVSWPSPAQQVKGVLDNLDNLVFSRPELRVVETNERAQFLRGAMPNAAQVEAFVGAYGPAWSIWMDQRRGRPSLIDGGAIAFIPGHANSLDWETYAPGCRSNDCLPPARVEKEARVFLERWRDLLGVDPTDLVLDPVGSQAVGNSIYLLRFQWAPGGIPVEGASVYFRINGGNLLQVATTRIGDLKLDLAPALGPDTAWQILTGYLGEPLRPQDEVLEKGALAIVPITPKGMDTERFEGAYGSMVDYLLCYRLVFRRTGVLGTWEGLVDAHSGELLRFVDSNLYGQIHGTLYLNSSQSNAMDMPLPYAKTGLPPPDDYADASGRFTGTVTTVTLAQGKHIRVTDSCGTTDLTTSTGDADYGQSAGTDCGVPSPNPGGGGNTWASKTAYYHLTEIQRKVVTFLPSSSWLSTGHTAAFVNDSGTCNGWADETSVHFLRSGPSCTNLGENPGTVIHEWGHLLDYNDGSGLGMGALSPPVETVADWTCILQLRASCRPQGAYPGTNCGGYGDPCTDCDGFRDADFSKHASNTPWTAQNHGSVWNCGAGSYNGPCGWEDHCESGISSQALWDFVNRDLPADCGISGSTAWQLAEALFFPALPSLGDLYTCAVGSPTVTDGCGGESLYTLMRVLDDSGDGTSNGTPHAKAIYHALARHNIACGAESDAKNQNQSTCPALSTPVLLSTIGHNRVSLTWTSGGTNATRYFVYKNDAGPNRGYTRIATVYAPSRSFVDTLATTGITSYYQVQAASGHDACTGHVSNAIAATPAMCSGIPALDRASFSCSHTVTVTLQDETVATPLTVTAWSTTDPAPKTVTLAETPPGSGQFVGTFQVSLTAGAGKVRVSHGDTLTVRYTDPDSCGSPNVAEDATAAIDCLGPAISGVQATNLTGSSALIIWDTDEPADSHLQYTPPPASASSSALTQSHALEISGLSPCTAYSFEVASSDESGNGSNASNFPFTTTPDLTPVLTRTPNQSIPDDDPAGAGSTLSVYGGHTIQDLDVGVTIQHTRISDLTLTLRSPSGMEIPLAINADGMGDNFTGTVFDDEAGTAISEGSAPFSGRYRPASPLSVVDGMNTTGNWRLTVIDIRPGETGTVLEWTLRPTYPAYSCGLQLALDDVAPTSDTCSGSGGVADGILDPGEEATLEVSLANQGSAEALQVSGTLTSLSPWATVTDGFSAFDDIPVGGFGTSVPEHFKIQVAPQAPCGAVLEFSLHFQCYLNSAGWDEAFTLTVGQVTPGPPLTVFAETFPNSGTPAGWVVERVNTAGGTFYASYDGSCSSEYALRHLSWDSPGDVWAHSPGISMAAGVPHTLSFVQWAEDTEIEGHSLSVWLGSAPAASAMIEVLWSETGLSDPLCNTRTASFTPTASGTYHLSFHCTSPEDQGFLYLDNLLLSAEATASCDMNPCTPCEDPGAPIVFQVSDPNPCNHSGVRVSFGAGSGADRHDLYMDGDLVLSGISSPVVYHPGDTVPHDFLIRAVSGTCFSDSASVEGTDEDSPTPAAPSPAATDWDECDLSGIRISWAPVPDATAYDLQVDGTTLVTGVTSPYIHQPPDTVSHSFKVRAKSGNCEGEWSGPVSASDLNITPGTPAAPGVADLNVCALTGVQITWGPVAGATSYDILVDGTTLLSGVVSPYTRLPGNSSSHNYQVRAWRSSCKGEYSPATAGADAINVATPAPPSVTDLDACAQSGVQVTWAAVPGATGYDLVIDGSDIMGDVSSPYLFDPRDTADHGYAIQAKAPGCTGDRSNPTVASDLDKSLGPPAGVRSNDLDACAASGIRVTWDPVAGATGYDLYVDDRDVFPSVTSPHTHLPGDPGTHGYRVRAKTASCSSGWSAADTAADQNSGVAAPAAPKPRDLDGCALTGVEIEWDPVSGATAYDLRVDGATIYATVVSPKTFEPGDSASHTFEIRGRNATCTGPWSAGTALADLNNTPGMALVGSVVDIDPAQPTGIRVNYTPGTGATRHDLYRDGVIVKADYASGATYVPGDSVVHSYRVRAWKETCFATSNSMPGTDQTVPPEIAPGDTSLTAQSWPDKTTHTWPSDASCTSGYLLYRGTLADLPKLMDEREDGCARFRGNASGENTVTGITEAPSAVTGRFYWYLVTGINGAGEGTAGNATEGPRLVDSSGNCPAP